MRILLSLGALALMGSTAFADTVVVTPAPDAVIEHRAADDTTTTSRTVTHDNGCATHSVTHSNSDTGSSVTQTKTNC